MRQDLVFHTLKEVSYETVSDYILSERNCPYVYGSGKSAKAADRLGVTIKVETEGGIGVENELTIEEIREADAIIIAADRSVNKDRFIGKNCCLSGFRTAFANRKN